MPPERLRNWVKAGLIQPAQTEHGVPCFDFRQVAAAKSLCDLLSSGVTLGRVRRSLEHLRTWMPDVDQPLQQLAILERLGPLLVRLEQGDLAETAGGQYHFDFTGEPDPSLSPMKIIPGPRTASEWFEQGLEQERHGYLTEAAGSYRQALLTGGPDAEVCFDLANVLRGLGERQQAMERYLQAVEIDSKFSDAWNNLGLCLAELEKPQEACTPSAGPWRPTPTTGGRISTSPTLLMNPAFPKKQQRIGRFIFASIRRASSGLCPGEAGTEGFLRGVVLESISDWTRFEVG